MTDSGFPQPPSSGPKIGPLSFPPGKADRQALVEDATGDLRDVRRPTRIEGTVINLKREGVIRVHTDRGDVDIRLRGSDPPPAEGEKVELEVPPGRPPRMVILRPMPPDAQPRAESPQPPQGQTQQAQTQQAQQGQIQSESPPPPSREVSARENQAAGDGARIKSDDAAPVLSGSVQRTALPPEELIVLLGDETGEPRAIAEGEIIRLVPLPPGVNVTVPAEDVLEAVVRNITVSTQHIAMISAEAVVDEQIESLLRVYPAIVIAGGYEEASLAPVASPPSVPMDAEIEAFRAAVLNEGREGNEAGGARVRAAEAYAPLPVPVILSQGDLAVPIKAAPLPAVIADEFFRFPVFAATGVQIQAAGNKVDTVEKIVEQLLMPVSTKPLMSSVNIAAEPLIYRSAVPAMHAEARSATGLIAAPAASAASAVISIKPVLIAGAQSQTQLPQPALLHHFPVRLEVLFESPSSATAQTLRGGASVLDSLVSTGPKLPDVKGFTTSPSAPGWQGAVQGLNVRLESAPLLPVKIVAPVLISPTDRAAADADAEPLSRDMLTGALNPFMPRTAMQALALPQDVAPKSVMTPVSVLQESKGSGVFSKDAAPQIFLQKNPAAIRASVIGQTGGKLPVLALVGADGKVTGQEKFVVPFSVTNFVSGAVMEFVPAVTEGGVAAAGSVVSGAYHAPYMSSALTGAAAGAAAGAAQQAALIPSAASWSVFGSLGWPVMDEIQNVLEQQGAASLAQAIRNIMPNPAMPARLPPAALLFIAVIQAGDIAQWLGEKTVETLRRAGRGDLVERAARDISSLQRSFAQASAQDWRALALPMAWQGEIHKMALYYRRDKQGDDQSGDEMKGGTRFVFDLNLSRMGAVQLDGYCRQKKLDLIVRTKSPLSGDMMQALRRLYTNALEQTQFSGEISFQGKPSQFLHIAPVAGDGTGISV